MKARLLNAAGEKTFAVIFHTGDEAAAGLLEFAKAHNVSAARFTAIGAFSRAKLGYFDWEQKRYLPIEIDEQVEVLSCVGDIALDGDTPVVHAHVVVGRKDGSTRGGHLMEGFVRPTLEVMLEESPVHLQKQHDPESGLALIAL